MFDELLRHRSENQRGVETEGAGPINRRPRQGSPRPYPTHLLELRGGDDKNKRHYRQTVVGLLGVREHGVTEGRPMKGAQMKKPEIVSLAFSGSSQREPLSQGEFRIRHAGRVVKGQTLRGRGASRKLRGVQGSTCPGRDSNPGHSPCERDALSTELPRHGQSVARGTCLEQALCG